MEETEHFALFGYSPVLRFLGKNSPFLQITANNQIPVLATPKKSRLTMKCANPITLIKIDQWALLY